MGCIVMSSINFDNVYLLLIAIPLIVLFTIPFLLAVRKDNRNGHNIASQIMHIVMAIIIAFAAAGTSITTVLTETDIYVVADVSYSANKNLDLIDNYIAALNLPRNSRLGLVCFGKDSQLICGLGKVNDLPSVKDAVDGNEINGEVDDSETNIAEALQFAGTLFEEDVIKRIVLITDGKQTDETDTYAMRRAIDSLEALEIKVDAIYLNDNIDETTKEVQISNVDFTHSAYINHEETALVSVQSTYAVNAVIDIYCNETPMPSKPVELTAGMNTVNISLDTKESGEHDYRLVIKAPEDKSELNNTFSFTQIVSDDVKMLVISDNWYNCTSLVEQYADEAAIDVFENDESVRISEKEAFKRRFANNKNVNINNLNKEIPNTIEELCKYDKFVLADVNITEYTNWTNFIKSLDKAVNLGKSLITMGNLYIQQDPNNEDLQKLDKMLPVRFGKNSGDSKLYTILIDSSRSMFQMRHLAVAKEAATKVIDALNDNDYLCVMAFSGEVRILMPPKELTNREEIVKEINELEVTQGTVIGKSLQRVQEMLASQNRFSDRQVLLISDGLEFGGDEALAPVVAKEMYDDGIVTSVFDVGRQGSDMNSAFLMNVAANGGGEYYNNRNAEHVDDVLLGQMKDDTAENVVDNRDTSVTVVRKSDAVLANINGENPLPEISGFVNSVSKASSTTVLSLNYVKAGSDTAKQVPLYSYWPYGDGKVSTFTSSFANRKDSSYKWLQKWIDNGVASIFFDNVFDTNTPEEKTSSPYTMDIQLDGTAMSVEIKPAEMHPKDTSAEITIKMPNGDVSTEELAWDEYHYYLNNIKIADVGKYEISVVYAYKSSSYEERTVLNISYSSEYDEFVAFEASPLFKALNGRGTVSTDGSLTIVNDENDVGTYEIDYTIPLLILCVVLYVVDIVVRKLKWEDVVSFFGGFKKSNKKPNDNKGTSENNSGGI